MIRLVPFELKDYKNLSRWIKNEKELVQFAGDIFSYPITKSQMQEYLNDDKRHVFSIFYLDENIGLGEIYVENKQRAKLCRILIGKKRFRGKGIGEIVVRKLLKKSFEEFGAKRVYLNVFDWNIGAIKCYEKCGMEIFDTRSNTIKVGDDIWISVGMEINKTRWEMGNLV